MYNNKNPDFKVNNIIKKSNKSEISRFFMRYKTHIDRIKESKYFRYPESIMGDYKITHKGQIRTGFKRLGNLTNDITVDTRNRTPGLPGFPIRVTLASCANGPAISSQVFDASLLIKDEYKPIRKAIKNLWWMYHHGLDLSFYEGEQGSVNCKYKNVQKLAKLFAIADKSCKTRVIAIPDTFTQIALRPIHFLLDHVMKHFKCDFYDNHQRGVEYLMSNKHRYFFSIDLVNATDCLPVEIGLEVLRIVLNRWESDSFKQWHRNLTVSSVKVLLTKHKFLLPDGQFVKYGTGQGMGLYASFPMLGLSQHFLVLLSYSLTYGGLNNFHNYVYAVVGDDLVITEREVMKNYLKLCNELKIPINIGKSIEGFDTFEFCSRIVVNGKMRSTPSLKAYFEASRSMDPYPLLKLFKEYHVPMPTWINLCRVFKRETLRNMLASNDLDIIGKPNIQKIPDTILSHADRVLGVDRNITSYKKSYKVMSEDPFESRLNYARTVISIYLKEIKRWKKRGKNLWYSVHKIYANTMYLGYLQTRFDRKRLRLEGFDPTRNTTRSKRIRELCMANRNQWKLIDSNCL